MSAGTLIALLYGPDQPGLVARTAGWIFEHGGNILHADQHRDREAGIFFQRIEWMPSPEIAPRSGLSGRRRPPVPILGARHPGKAAEEFRLFAESLGMKARVTASTWRPRVAVFVSKSDHCFHDLALRWRARDFPGEIAAVISNHKDLAGVVRRYRLPFHFIPVTPSVKAKAERKQLDILRRHEVDLVILARYMQVLSAGFLKGLSCPAINIHHSFLPAFAGGRPYHQAHARGVKLIGATAHYVTAELDDGPIIHQDVGRVTHRDDVEELVRIGRDLEKQVLARAVRWHLESRVLAYGNKTVVFD